MECIFEVVPAGRGAILLSDNGGGEFASVFAWDRRAGLVPAFPVSGTVARRVTEEKVGLLCVNLGSDRELQAAKSLLLSQTRSLLAVPLVAFDNVLGLIYLDSTESGALLTEDHLQLMTAIAAISAIALENARHMDRLEGENRRLQAEIAIQHNMVGESEPMRKVYRFISKVAPTDSTVLITGESGTGKELIARAIHQNSRARQQAVCRDQLRRAHRNAARERIVRPRKRRVHRRLCAQERASWKSPRAARCSWTRSGELAPQLQAKLLRVLQEREFERVGGTRTIHVDIRVIGATNRDLEEWAAEGKFRQDLYYRLNVVAMTSPSLRQRREDIPLLASYFAAKAGQKANRQVHGISPGRARLPDALRMARQCARAGKCHRARRGAGIVRFDSARGFAGNSAGSPAGGRRQNRHVSRSHRGSQEAVDPEGRRASGRQLHRGRQTAGRAPELSAPADSQYEFEGGDRDGGRRPGRGTMSTDGILR